MKSVICICGLTLLVYVAYVRSEIDEEAAAECAKGFHLEHKDAIKDLMTSDAHLTDDIKCFSKCYMQKVGLMNEDGDIEEEMGFKEMFRDREVADDSKDKFVAAVKVCSEKHDKSNCDFAGHAYRCILAEMHLEDLPL